MENIWFQIAISSLVFVTGAAVGSFLNLVIFRLPKNIEIFRKRSFCPKCKVTIASFDIIPIFSYFALGGRCRSCQKKISAQYPLVEIITVLLFLVSFWAWEKRFGANLSTFPELLHLFLIVSVLIVIWVIDARHNIIPDSVLVLAIFGSIVLIILSGSNFSDILLRFETAVGAFVFFGVIILATLGRGMGVGDAKFVFWLGLIFPFPQIIQVLFLSFIAGAIYAVILIVAKKAKFGQTIPFGPFLSFGALISLFFADQILQWYLAKLL